MRLRDTVHIAIGMKLAGIIVARCSKDASNIIDEVATNILRNAILEEAKRLYKEYVEETRLTKKALEKVKTKARAQEYIV
ncbi:MAG: hypothetical protein DRN15_06370 [Thermoprotei archaeon]|nr:MAG: hypothetical protein DRN15_06370 [Thermoprotei archaeon]